MFPKQTEAWQDFFVDHQTNRALQSSEVYCNYISSELAREERYKKAAIEQKIEEDNKLLEEVNQLNLKIASNPLLKAKFKQARDYLENHPEEAYKVDPNFIRGLKLLSLEE